MEKQTRRDGENVIGSESEGETTCAPALHGQTTGPTGRDLSASLNEARELGRTHAGRSSQLEGSQLGTQTSSERGLVGG